MLFLASVDDASLANNSGKKRSSKRKTFPISSLLVLTSPLRGSLRVFLINPALHSSTSSQTHSKHTMTLFDHSRAQERDAAKEAHRNDEKQGLLKKMDKPKIVKKLTKQLGRVPTADEIAKAKEARKQEKRDKAFFLGI